MFRPHIPILLGQNLKGEEMGGAYVTHGKDEKFL